MSGHVWGLSRDICTQTWGGCAVCTSKWLASLCVLVIHFALMTSRLRLLVTFAYSGFSSQIPCPSSVDPEFSSQKFFVGSQLGFLLCLQNKDDDLINREECFSFKNYELMC